MFHGKRAKLEEPQKRPEPSAEGLDSLVDEFVETLLWWQKASDDVRAAYDRWLNSPAEQDDLAFAGYHAALDREDQAARVYSIRTERLRAAMGERVRPGK